MTILLLLSIVIFRTKAISCKDMSDCSYNGICNVTTNMCSCFIQWKGMHCAELNIIPGSVNTGLRIYENNSRVSTWGGSVLKDSNNIYHMIAAEITYNCGIEMWLSNSIIIHATTTNIFNEPFKKVDIVQGIFSHEPDFVKALDTGEFVTYFSNEYPPKTYGQKPCTDCYNGDTSKYCSMNKEYQGNSSIPCPTKMKYSSNMNATNSIWSNMSVIPMMEPQPLRPADSNLACYIFPNGSLIGIGRYANSNNSNDDLRGYYLTKATNWKKNETYTNLDITFNFPKDPGEDPMIWYDQRYDVLHAVWHYNNETNWGYALGMHTFSIDGGINWIGYFDFDSYPEEYAYQSYTLFTDGPPVNFTRCERPHVILDDDGVTPIALTNAVVEPATPQGDYSFTLLRPIKQNN